MQSLRIQSPFQNLKYHLQLKLFKTKHQLCSRCKKPIVCNCVENLCVEKQKLGLKFHCMCFECFQIENESLFFKNGKVKKGYFEYIKSKGFLTQGVACFGEPFQKKYQKSIDLLVLDSI